MKKDNEIDQAIGRLGVLTPGLGLWRQPLSQAFMQSAWEWANQ